MKRIKKVYDRSYDKRIEVFTNVKMGYKVSNYLTCSGMGVLNVPSRLDSALSGTRQALYCWDRGRNKDRQVFLVTEKGQRVKVCNVEGVAGRSRCLYDIDTNITSKNIKKDEVFLCVNHVGSIKLKHKRDIMGDDVNVYRLVKVR